MQDTLAENPTDDNIITDDEWKWLIMTIKL